VFLSAECKNHFLTEVDQCVTGISKPPYLLFYTKDGSGNSLIL